MGIIFTGILTVINSGQPWGDFQKISKFSPFGVERRTPNVKDTITRLLPLCHTIVLVLSLSFIKDELI